MHRAHAHEGEDEEAHGHQDQHEALPALEPSGDDAADQGYGHEARRDRRADPEEPERVADADELGDEGEEVQQEEVDDAEGGPEGAEALSEQLAVADTGDGTEPDHHLLGHREDDDEDRQRPQQRVAVGLAGLGIGGDTTGVVVADHDDDAWAEDREQREQTPAPVG